MVFLTGRNRDAAQKVVEQVRPISEKLTSRVSKMNFESRFCRVNLRTRQLSLD
jgi:hypothetical protein